MSRVLVMDASERSALAVIRSLGSKGIEVVAGDSIGFNAGFLSRYCSQRVLYPSPLKNKAGFVESIIRFVKNADLDLLIPVTDFTILPLVERRDEVERYVRLALPSNDILFKAFDKWETAKLAESMGVPCPKTFVIKSVEDLNRVAEEVNYPCVIKPRTKVFWFEGKAIVLKITPDNYAYSQEDLIRKFSEISSRLEGFEFSEGFFIIQEFAEGVGYGVEVLMDGVEAKAVFIHKRLREYPITGGASTYRISVINRRLEELALKILKEIRWNGVAMVEFKVNESNNDVALIEINGRFWGSLPLAVNAGIDFPYLLYKLMMNGDVEPNMNYLVGMLQRWLFPGDFLWLFSSLIEGKNKFEKIIQFLGSSWKNEDIFSFNDITPILGVLSQSIYNFTDVIKGQKTIYGETN